MGGCYSLAGGVRKMCFSAHTWDDDDDDDDDDAVILIN